MKAKPITVAELIAQLQLQPQDAYVHTQGCDCEGPCSGVGERVLATAVNADGTLRHARVVVLERDDDREQC